MNAWEVLSEEMLRENAHDEVFLKARVTPKALQETYEANRAVLFWAHEFVESAVPRIVAYAAIFPGPEPQWYEFGALFVALEFRQKFNLSNRLYAGRIELMPEGSRAFTVTHNPKAVARALKYGFQEATRENWRALAPYALVCGPCDRWQTDEEKVHCPYRAVPTECRLFVR
jgi:hypothetical protein